MFVEKYRPKEFEDVVGLDNSIVELVKGDMPHFLFLGPAGTGKTTTAKIIVTKTGVDCLRLNGSDERGIDTIRDKVKEYAMTRSTNGKFKIVFLDEADYLTKDAQAILRNLMETYAKNCRFIMTANFGNKIIEPLHSRTAKFEFKQPEKEEVKKRLNHIAKEESINIEEKAVEVLIKKYYPDIRSMINKIEDLSKKGKITESMISVEEHKLQALAKLIKDKEFTKARTWIMESTDDPHHLLNGLMNLFLDDDSLKIEQKVGIVEAIGETEFRLGLSVDKEVQISAGLTRIMRSI